MTAPLLTTEGTLRVLAERYPFDKHELEILVRCHEHVLSHTNGDDFLLQLALASPYAHFFLPGDEMTNRVAWIEDHILPAGFASSIRASISVDAFVEYANQGQTKSLERFIEGVADATGRRGTREALRALFRLVGVGDGASATDVMDCVVRLVVADQALNTPNLDNKKATLQQLQDWQPLVPVLAEAVQASLGVGPEDDLKDEKALVRWTESNFPLLAAPLSTFVHHLLFHGHPYPAGREIFSFPQLDQLSDVFACSTSGSASTVSTTSLMAMAFMGTGFGTKWHRLYSSGADGRSFNRLEWSLLGYTGPTILVVKTIKGATLGAFTATPWKEVCQFYGTPNCFLMELEPNLRVHRPKVEEGGEDHYMYLHSSASNCQSQFFQTDHPFGLGMGGTLTKPRFFIPESLEHASADFLDKTFESGELLPAQEMEQFEIQHLEVWAVGGTAVIQQALHDRAKHREIAQATLEQARTVLDKSVFGHDLKSGLIPQSHIFAHTEQVRGRQEFRVDEQHGGYIIDDK